MGSQTPQDTERPMDSYKLFYILLDSPRFSVTLQDTFRLSPTLPNNFKLVQTLSLSRLRPFQSRQKKNSPRLFGNMRVADDGQDRNLCHCSPVTSGPAFPTGEQDGVPFESSPAFSLSSPSNMLPLLLLLCTPSFFPVDRPGPSLP